MHLKGAVLPSGFHNFSRGSHRQVRQQVAEHTLLELQLQRVLADDFQQFLLEAAEDWLVEPIMVIDEEQNRVDEAEVPGSHVSLHVSLNDVFAVEAHHFVFLFHPNAQKQAQELCIRFHAIDVIVGLRQNVSEGLAILREEFSALTDVLVQAVEQRNYKSVACEFSLFCESEFGQTLQNSLSKGLLVVVKVKRLPKYGIFEAEVDFRAHC